MLANSVYKKIFPDPRGVIGFVPMASGIGGQLAEYGAFSLMRSWGLKFEIIPGQKLQEAPCRVILAICSLLLETWVRTAKA